MANAHLQDLDLQATFGLALLLGQLLVLALDSSSSMTEQMKRFTQHVQTLSIHTSLFQRTKQERILKRQF